VVFAASPAAVFFLVAAMRGLYTGGSIVA
jgi:hypothetical protein